MKNIDFHLNSRETVFLELKYPGLKTCGIIVVYHLIKSKSFSFDRPGKYKASNTTKLMLGDCWSKWLSRIPHSNKLPHPYSPLLFQISKTSRVSGSLAPGCA